MADKKTAIIRATIAAIAKYGLNKTNAQLVASEMGIAQSSVFYHFPTQKKLNESLVPFISKSNAMVVKGLLKEANAQNNFERLCHYIRGNLIWAMTHRDQVMVLVYALAEGKHSEQICSEVSSILKTAEDRLYFYLVAGVAEKEFTIDSNLRSLAKFINQSVNGSVLTQFQLYDDWSVDSYMDELTVFLKGVIHLIRTD